MENFNKILGPIVLFVSLLTACSKEGEPIKIMAGDEIISRKGLPIDGTQEVPAVSTKGCGTLDVSYNKTTKMLTYSVTWHSLTGNPVGAHIHGDATRGMNAPVVYNFTDLIPKTTSGTFTNSVLVDEIAIKEADLLKGLYYVNIHTPQNPGGEIRGQIELIKPEIISKKGLLIDGTQEVPMVDTKACGTLDVSYNKTAKILTYKVTWKMLTGEPVGAHIHGDAPRGMNAPVKYNFTDLIPKTVSGTFTNSVVVDEIAIKEDDLLKGLYYVNIHTPLNPGGEIRGQIEFKKPEIISKKGLLLEGSQESPMITTAASGKLDISYNKTSKILYYTVSWKSLSSIPVGSHIHGDASRGENAPVKVDFTAALPKTVDGTYSGMVVVDEVAIMEADLLSGKYYVNIHTALNPGGEIRGQMEF